MTSALKCNRCNIVIDEMLAFIQNKISVIDEDSLSRICLTAFNSEQIDKSWTLLFESIPSEKKKKPVRKGPGKESRVISDIVNLLKSTESDNIPVFVAKDLEKLPPVTFDHVDVTKLLKDLTLMRANIEELKSTCVTVQQFQEMEAKVRNLKYLSLPSPHLNVNNRRGAYQDSGPIGLSILNNSEISKHEIETQFRDIIYEAGIDAEKQEGSSRTCCERDLSSKLTASNGHAQAQLLTLLDDPHPPPHLIPRYDRKGALISGAKCLRNLLSMIITRRHR